ncbi:MAG: transposase family protein [Moorea sp. SIO4G2]|nr:transposase family protein [Moorena sp. SIO4G2]
MGRQRGLGGLPHERLPWFPPLAIASRQGELTDSQKADNKLLSKSRIFVEHVIGFAAPKAIRRVKIFKIVQERFRLNKKRYESVILTVCGLVRLRSDAARSWEGSAVLGVSPMSDCRGFPHSLLHQDIGSLILEVSI